MSRPSVEEERRAQILDATRRVITRRGLSLLRIADVADEAGLSPGIVHYYFSTKEELIRDTFEYNFSESLERRAEIFEQDSSPAEKLDAFIASYLPSDEQTAEAWHIWLELWAGALHDAELRGINERAYGQWREMVSGLIQEGCKSGEFVSEEPVEDANQLISMIDGLAVQVILTSESISLADMRRICAGFVRDILYRKNLV